MVRIAHIADTHIRNYKYHKEYREIFSRMYKLLKKKKVDYIIHCGDIAHTKTQLSPEYFDMCGDFLSSLADIAPTHVILGNHDGNLKNQGRLDAVTPVAEALEHPNLFIHRDSQEVQMNEEITLNVLSVFDKDNWIEPTNDDKINIALFHGSVSGCKTDLGWTMENGEVDLKTLQNFDYAFLGDIHKTNQILDKKGKIRYPGSTVQQNFGESNDKGFVIWDIENRDKYTCTHYAIPNPKPFITIVLTPKGKLPRGTDLPPGARVRLQAKNKLPLDAIMKAKSVVASRFKPESVVFNNSTIGSSSGEHENIFAEEGNLRDTGVQEKFIREYLTDYNPDEETLQEVFNLNKKYNAEVEQSEDVSRYVNWSLKKLEFDNFFNYGEGNSLDFDMLSGVIGVFGKNFSGKSSVVDTLLYTLFNSTSKNERKSVGIINQQKDYAHGKATIQVNDRLFLVDRTLEKYKKRLHGVESTEAKTMLDFSSNDLSSGETESLNGLTRTDTDNNIRKQFGTLEDFLTTSMSSQLGSLTFVSEGNKNRKKILAKFLDLLFFNKKHLLAKEEAAETKALLRKLEQRNYADELEDATISQMKIANSISDQSADCKKLKAKTRRIKKDITSIQQKIDSIPREIIDIGNLMSLIEKKQIVIEECRDKNKEHANLISLKRGKLNSITEFSASFGYEDKKERKRKLDELNDEVSVLTTTMNRISRDIDSAKQKSLRLEEVPCGDEYSHCRFICDAHESKSKLKDLESQFISFDSLVTKKRGQLQQEDPNKLQEHIEKYNQLMLVRGGVETEITKLQLSMEKNNGTIKGHMTSLSELNNKLELYNANKEIIENLNNLESMVKQKKEMLLSVEEEIECCEQQLISLHKQEGTFEEKIKNLNEQKEQLEEYQKKYAAYDLFMRCMHPNGISYKIIKNKLPIINEEISKILSNIVEFEVFFENSEEKLDIYIKHPKYDARPIELGSGAEKTLAAMAIRLALLNVSSLPKGDIFILDEPGTALDEENMEGFIRIIDLVKSQFKNVILISHLDSLKDCVDMTIDIDKVDGYACVNS